MNVRLGNGDSLAYPVGSIAFGMKAQDFLFCGLGNPRYAGPPFS
jgi:hypothetical protein